MSNDHDDECKCEETACASDVDDMEFKSLDKDMINKNLKGSHIKVHVDNLMAPDECRSVRHLNAKHVKALTESFKTSYSTYTTLIGLLTTDSDLNMLSEPGKAAVQVLGGNHTRAALQMLREESTHKENENYHFVFMDIYTKLTNEQSWYLGYLHNEIHEHSTEMTFPEKVIFFHKSLMRCQEKYPGKPNKFIATKWRSEIAAIVNKSKTELKNSFKVHLCLASCKAETWEGLLEVFKAFEKKTIKGQKITDNLTQYSFTHFYKIKGDDEKKTLLRRIVQGEITLEEFRNICENGMPDNVEDPSISSTAHSTNPKKRPKTVSFPDKVKELEKELDKQKKDREKITRQNRTLEEKLKGKELEIQSNCFKMQSLVEREEKMKQEYEKRIESYKRIIDKQKNVTDILKREVDELRKNAEREKEKCQFAEEAASRARLQLNDVISKKTVSKTIKRKNEFEKKEDCVAKQRKVQKTDQRPLENEDLSVEVLIVEYTKGKVYLAIKTDELITYCYKPIGKIVEDQFIYNPEKLSFKINEKDKQTFEENFVIVRMMGYLNNNSIKVDKLSLNVQQQTVAIKQYAATTKSKC